MFASLGAIKGDNGIFYGHEWKEDAFDLHIDRLLLAAAHKAPGSRERIAVDVGCGTGYRASLLATLGIFDRVVACDVNDRTKEIETRREMLAETFAAAAISMAAPRTALDFLQTGAADLRLPPFPKAEITFVNFRNVGHFLAPCDFRAALANIGRVAASGALVAISFDCLREDGKQRGGPVLSFSDDKNPESFYNDPFWLKQSHAPYGNYRAREVSELVENLGFSLLPSPPATNAGDLRFNECRLLASAP